MDKIHELNYRWIISYLVVAIILLISLHCNHTSDLYDKLSFALTLSSLLLAILAIFYTIISANRQDEQLSRLLSTNNIDKAAQEIAKTSQEVRSTISLIPGHLQSMDTKLDVLTDKYSSINKNTGKEIAKTQDIHLLDKFNNKVFGEMISNFHFTGMGVLYLFSKAYLKSKSIQFDMFEDLRNRGQRPIICCFFPLL